MPFPYNVIQCFISRPNIGLSAFGQFFQTSEFNGFLFPNITWNSGFWLLKKIEIQCSAFCKHWNSRILLFEKLHFSVFAYPNIGILDFGFFNIRIQCFGFSKHRNCEFWFFETMELWILAFSTLEFSVGFSKHRMSVKKCKLLNVWLTNNTSGLENNIANILQLFKY